MTTSIRMVWAALVSGACGVQWGCGYTVPLGRFKQEKHHGAAGPDHQAINTASETDYRYRKLAGAEEEQNHLPWLSTNSCFSPSDSVTVTGTQIFIRKLSNQGKKTGKTTDLEVPLL